MTPVAEPELIAVGDVMVDVAVGGAGHAGAVRIHAGGSSAGVAAWAAAAGARSTVVGRVGDDLPGRLLRAALDERGVRTLLTVDETERTGSVVRLADGSTVVDRGASARLAAADLPTDLRAGAVVVSGYALLRGGSADAARAALARARAAWVVVDVAGPVPGAGVAYDGATALLANAEAARALTGLGAEEAVRELGRRHRLACVTRGADGAVAVLEGAFELAAAPPVEVVDASGAGDAFAAGILVSLLRGAPLGPALACGCRFGGLAASSFDAWPEPGTRLRAP
jgi:sugar/nucleoside kinase (ribokinase family)